MTTRRGYLAGLGTLGLTALAGCEALEGSKGDSPDPLEPEALDGWVPGPIQEPSVLPFSLPPDLAEDHETRTRSLLDSVPSDPSIPNGVIESSIRKQRAQVETRITEGSDAETPVAELRDWRRFRGDAANVYGSYSAATGQGDGAAVRERRSRVREGIGTFEASIAYSAASPLEAVLVYAPIEELLERAAQESRPHHPYPEDPVANVEQAGEAVESIEAAAAALDDSRGIHETYLASRQGTEPRGSTLIDMFRGLEIAVDRTRRERIPDPESADHESLFAGELRGVDFELFQIARRTAETRHEPLRRYRDTGQYAAAVIEAGRQLAGIAAFDAVITALESNGGAGTQADETDEGQSVTILKSAATNAAETLGRLHQVDYPHLSSAIGDPGVSSYRIGRRNLGEDYFGPLRAEASFRFASLYGAAAPKAGSFLVDHIERAR